MSRLSDLYKAMETLRKEGLPVNEDLERKNEAKSKEKENEIESLNAADSEKKNLPYVYRFLPDTKVFLNKHPELKQKLESLILSET